MEERLNSYLSSVSRLTDDDRQAARSRYFSLRAAGASDDTAYATICAEYPAFAEQPCAQDNPQTAPAANATRNVILRAVAIAMYILCVLPVILFGDGNGKLGVALMFIMIAVATALIIIAGSDRREERRAAHEGRAVRREKGVTGAVTGLLWCIGVCVYGWISITTGAWYITWMVFPICAALANIIEAIADIIEAKDGVKQ